MRPIHAVLLFVGLAAVLVGALLLVRSDTRSGRIAPPIAGPESGSETRKTAPDLVATPGTNPSDPGAERAHVASGGDATIVTGPIGLRGRVVDPEGRGVADATVYAASSDMPFGIALDDVDAESPLLKRKSTTTDRDGRFTLQPEAQSAVRLAVRAAGFAPYNAQKPIAGANVDVGDLKLERGVVLMGQVLDEAARPVPNAELHLARSAEPGGGFSFPGSHGPLLGKTDSAGRFKVDRLAVGPWSLLVTSDEHPDKTESGETDRAGQVVSNLLITLDAGADIAGRVVGGPASGFADLRVAASERGEGEDAFGGFAKQRKAPIAADGTFRIRGCKRDTNYRVSARKAENGFGSGQRSDTVAARSGELNVVLTYRPETAITCRVVDKSSGKPVETLNVSAGYRWAIPLIEEVGGKPRTRFENGSVRFAPVAGGPATETAVLRIEAVGYATFEREDLHLIAGTDNDLGVIQLERSALVRVTVVDDGTSAPIANASVSLNELAPGRGELGLTFSIDTGGDDEPVFGGEGAGRRGKTDKEGRVSLTSLPGKQATLSVRHREHAAWKSATLDLPTIGDHEVTVRLKAGGSVVVEVIDRDKRPVASLTIDHRDPEMRGQMFLPGMQSDTITDAAGRVVFAHIPAGRHLFRVRPTGGGGAMMASGAIMTAAVGGSGGPTELEQGWSEIVAVEGETVTLVLDAPQMGELHGRVREGGKPLAGATVRLREKRDDAFGLDLPFLDRPLSTTTTASGEYTLAGSPVGDYQLVVTHPARAMKWEGDVTVRTGELRFDVDLPLATIEGRITDEAGKPIEGAKVSAERAKKADSEPGRGANVEMNVVMIGSLGDEGEMISFGGGADAPVVKTDADGRYRLRGVTPNVPLQVVVSGRNLQPTRSDRIELATDQTLSGFDLVMKQGGSVEVTARRPDGRTVSGAMVRAEPVAGEAAPKTLFTGLEGRATFEGLEPGRWKFTCERTAFEPDARDVKMPAREVDVRAGRTEKIAFDLPQ